MLFKDIQPEILDISYILSHKAEIQAQNELKQPLTGAERTQLDKVKGKPVDKVLKAIELSDIKNKEAAKQYVQNV